MMLNACRRSRSLCAIVAGVMLGACGGDGGGPTSPPVGPPPPPPPPPIGASLDLAPGEVRVLSDVASIRAFEIVGASEAREYQVIVMSAARTEEGVTPLRWRASAVGASTNRAPPGGEDAAGLLPPPSRSIGPDFGRDPRLARGAHLDLLSAMQAEAARRGARSSPKLSSGRPVEGPRGAAASTATTASTVPQVGETMTIKSGITPGGGLTCNLATPIDGVVKSVGQNFIIVEDPEIAGRLDPADYAELDQELDDFVAPVDQDYFGTPEDLDANQRTVAFFTTQVNRLADVDAGLIVLGFFNFLDLLDPVDCPSSNESEIVWLLGPDPDGDFGFGVSVDFVKEIARGLVAHEYQHLINASRRLAGQTGPVFSLADLWVNEGLSHVGEEVSGLHRVGLATRQNLGFAEIGVGSPMLASVFADFHGGNLLNVQDYLAAPTEFTALATTNANLDFATRGFGYFFLRWLGDRYGPDGPAGVVPGSGENALFRELAEGGPAFLFGIDNILRAINIVSGESPTWEEVLGEYFAATASDDALASGLPDEIQFSTWNLPRLWDEMQAASVPSLSGGYPLAQRDVQMGVGVASTSDFDLRSSTARYFTLRASGSHPTMIVETTARTGANVPNGANARIVVVRTQ